MPMYIFTTDSHDYFGPFYDPSVAHFYAKSYGLTSYQIVFKIPKNIEPRKYPFSLARR